MISNVKKIISFTFLLVLVIVFFKNAMPAFAQTKYFDPNAPIANPYGGTVTNPQSSIPTTQNGNSTIITQTGAVVDTATGNTLISSASCTAASAQFDLGSAELDAALDDSSIVNHNTLLGTTFYGDGSSRPPVTIKVSAPSCAGETIWVSLLSYHALGSNVPVSALNYKSFIVPSTGNFQINMIAGQDDCSSVIGNYTYGATLPTCLYVIKIYDSKDISEASTIFDSSGGTFSNWNKYPRGWLGYNLATSSNLGSTPWQYLSDTSANPASSNPVVVTTAGTSDACSGQTGECYQLYSGLTDVFGALGTKLSVITQATSLGQFLNAIIEIIIGIAGVLAVVRIMYLGVIYMRSDDGNVTNKLSVRGAIIQTVWGFILLLLIYTILRTINPDLLNLTPNFNAATFPVVNNSANPAFQSSVTSVNVTNIPYSNAEINDPVFLTYLAHQQGLGGAETILWATRKGYTSIPSTSPFATNANSINGNMASNVGSDFASVTGSPNVTPQSFVDYWARKIQGFEQSSANIPGPVLTAVKQASTDTSEDLTTLIVMCRIESGCVNPTTSNPNGFSGLFQESAAIFTQYAPANNAGILDPYANAYVAAKYGEANLPSMQKSLNTN